jgi:hypothetical protein
MARTRTQAVTTQENTTYVQSDANVGFRAGVMYVGGMPQIPTQRAQWESSNGLSVYTTVTWRDPTNGQLRTSCNCPGWANSAKRGKRHCCHTKDMEGIERCDKNKHEEARAITTVADVAAFIPTITHDGAKELRGIMLED